MNTRPPDRGLTGYRRLLDSARALATAPGEDELYAAIHRETSRLFPVDRFSVVLYGPEEDASTVVFQAGTNGRNGPADHAEPGEAGGASGESTEGGRERAAAGHETRRHGAVVGLSTRAEEPVRAAAIVPLRYRERTLGALWLGNFRREIGFGDEDMELLQELADIAGASLENVRRVGDLERRRREAEWIERAGRALGGSLDVDEVLARAIRSARTVLGSDGAFAARIHGDPPTLHLEATSGLEIVRPEEDLSISPEAVEELRAGTPVVVGGAARSAGGPATGRSAREEFRRWIAAESAMVVPVPYIEEGIAVLVAGDVRKRHYDEDEERLMRTLAGQVSLALKNAYLHDRIRTLSLTDPLTGLPNRRYLDVELDRELAAAERGRPLSLVLFDLDQFKAYNDAYGHLAGDAALRAFAGILEDETRTMNFAARFGGDEFVAILAGSGEEGARSHAGRVSRRTEEHPLLGPAGIGVSWGMASWEPGVEKPEDLLDRADADLYRSKREGPEGSP